MAVEMRAEKKQADYILSCISHIGIAKDYLKLLHLECDISSPISLSIPHMKRLARTQEHSSKSERLVTKYIVRINIWLKAGLVVLATK